MWCFQTNRALKLSILLIKGPLTVLFFFFLQCPSSVFDSECLARINSNDDSLGESCFFGCHSVYVYLS